MLLHPRPDNHGKAVTIHHPHEPSALATWGNAKAASTVVPEGPLPASLNGIPMVPWGAADAGSEVWDRLASGCSFEDPPFDPKGMKAASGAVVVESDGQVWLVAPTNAYGGYKATFPKGTSNGRDLRATAIKEVFEESGLQVELSAFLVDVSKSVSRTRYYLAHRTGGSPAAMGWESQAVHLAPLSHLKELLNSPNDMPILDALKKTLAASPCA